MRILYAAFCVWLWCLFLEYAGSQGCVLSDNIEALTISIIAAGALAGGD